MKPPLLAATLLLTLGACAPVEGPGWERSTRTVEIEPGTGDTIITQYWVIGGSRTTATYKRIPKGNTDRRGEPPPPQAPREVE